MSAVRFRREAIIRSSDCSNLRMKPSLGLIEPTIDPVAKLVAPPTFLVIRDPWHRIFFSNLTDLFWNRRSPAIDLSSPPGAFWPDVFVKSRLPWNGFLESGIYHVIVALLLLGVPGFWPQRPRVLDRPVFNSADVVYYSPAEYLPPIDTGVQHDQLPQRADHFGTAGAGQQHPDDCHSSQPQTES